jgi:hypothetical protein
VAQVRCGQLQTDLVLLQSQEGLHGLARRSQRWQDQNNATRIRDSSQDLETFSKTRSGGPPTVSQYTAAKQLLMKLIHICRLGWNVFWSNRALVTMFSQIPSAETPANVKMTSLSETYSNFQKMARSSLGFENYFTLGSYSSAERPDLRQWYSASKWVCKRWCTDGTGRCV